MAWELPSSSTRALGLLATSHVRNIEGEDSVVPTVELLSLDRPPFRSAGVRFYGTVEADTPATTGMTVVLSLRQPSASVFAVVDYIHVAAHQVARVRVGITPNAFAGAIIVTTPEQRTPTGVGNQSLTIDNQLNDPAFVTHSLWTSLIPAYGQTTLPTEIVLGFSPNNWAGLYVWCSTVSTLYTVTISGRLWQLEE